MPDVNIVSKESFDSFKGKQDGNVKSIEAANVDKTYVPGSKSSNPSKLSKNDYMQDKIDRFPGKSASEINNIFGSNVIGEKNYDEFNTLAGLKKAVTYKETGTVDRENETNITSDGEKSITYTVSGGDNTSTNGEGKTIETSNKTGDSGKRLFKRKNNQKYKNQTVESKTGKFCVNPNDSTCDMDVAKLQGASDKADDKAYNKAQKDRSYRVKKDGTQVLKKKFAPGEWFSDKMETHKINKARNQGQSNRRKEQREINKQRNKRNRANSREHQHNNPQNYNKVSNFFRELSYKEDKPKKSRTVKASF